jgi:hypothetical protein
VRVGLGLKARTGRAIAVAVCASPLQLIERAQMRLLPEGAFAPYHVAEALPPDQRQASVDRDMAAAHRLAESGIRDVVVRLRDAGHDVCACGVLTGGVMPPWTTDEIVAVHVRMHQAEGKLFRDVLVAGARACGFDAVKLAEKSALDDAASALRIGAGELASRLASLGKSAGAPWGRDQKEAALAAMVALAQA